MQAKQIFSTYNSKEASDLGQFKHCPFCGTQLVLKEKGGRRRPACSNLQGAPVDPGYAVAEQQR